MCLQINDDISCFLQLHKQNDAPTRAMDLDMLSEEMWCNQCQIPLSFRNIVDEKRKGIASVFTVRCMQCSMLQYVHTFKYNSVTKTYDVNGKLAFGKLKNLVFVYESTVLFKVKMNDQSLSGMLDGGQGPTHINNLLSSIDMPTLSTKTLKKYERQIGAAIETVCEESCVEAIQLEKKLTLEKEPQEPV